MAERRQKDKARTRGFAPSGDIESMEKMEASDEAKAHQRSDVDAMGQDKRRQVIGHAYGPSRKSQLMFFVVVGAVVAIAIGGYALAIAAFDQPQDDYADAAPWAQTDAEQRTTRSPSGPCGEPGNAYPPPDDSPCTAGGVRSEASGEDVSDQKAVEESGATAASQ
jgi:hypothetical protein